jgi:predicted ABC-type ATPase
MDLPILERMKEGVKFDFETLSDNVEKADIYWDWWWKEKAKFESIGRPETIEDCDDILTETFSKPFVDTICHREAIDDPLLRLLNEGVIPTSQSLDREIFRDLAMKIVAVGSVSLPEPTIVFAGGGYGSGKTTVLGFLAENGGIPCKGTIGADMFKQLIPEYHLIKAVADGRASLTVQKECMMLVKRLYPQLIEQKRSFVMDSSMSDQKETLARINLAKKSGYNLTMVAVLTPLNVAINQAMHRAKISRRFPHPKALPESHIAFRQHFTKYSPLFDKILVYANPGGGVSMSLVARKNVGSELEIFDSKMFNSAIASQQ